MPPPLAMPLAGALLVRFGSRALTRATLALLFVALPLPGLVRSLPALLGTLALTALAGLMARRLPALD